jgi:transposase
LLAGSPRAPFGGTGSRWWHRPVGGVQEAILQQLPNAKISVDPFHLVQLANLMVTRVRQRLVREREQRRGRKIDPAWAQVR